MIIIKDGIQRQLRYTDKINNRHGQWRSNISFINIFCVHWKYETHKTLYLKRLSLQL